MFEQKSADWLGTVQEVFIDPSHPIVDPHRHPWDARSIDETEFVARVAADSAQAEGQTTIGFYGTAAVVYRL